MRYFRAAFLALLLVALAAPQPASARYRPSDEDFTQLMYCPVWLSCAVRMFYHEDVQVVASYGYVDVDYGGIWGARGGCPECEWEAGPYSAPAPEPIEEGGSDECGNPDLNLLMQEYRDNDVLGTYNCSTFGAMGQGRFYTNPTHGNVTHSHGIVTASLLGNIMTMEAILEITLHISGGYRCAVRNAAIPGAKKQSRHLHGTAGDMYWSSSGHTETQHNQILAAAESTYATWHSVWTTYTSDRHFHAHWGTAF